MCWMIRKTVDERMTTHRERENRENNRPINMITNSHTRTDNHRFFVLYITLCAFVVSFFYIPVLSTIWIIRLFTLGTVFMLMFLCADCVSRQCFGCVWQTKCKIPLTNHGFTHKVYGNDISQQQMNDREGEKKSHFLLALHPSENMHNIISNRAFTLFKVKSLQ